MAGRKRRQLFRETLTLNNLERVVRATRTRGPKYAIARAKYAVNQSKKPKDTSKWLAYPEAQPAENPRAPFRTFTAATILDEFSQTAWGYEFDLVPLSAEHFQEQLVSNGVPQVDFLFVESAWKGNGGQWSYQLTGSNAPSPALVEVVQVCRAHGIPTVFWNKEDPVHFDDFIDSARLFEHIFTTDQNMIDEYERRAPDSEFHVLPFAAQPAMHNPITKAGTQRTGDIAFAGSYFTHKFKSRQEQIDLILNAAMEADKKIDQGLVIYSRFVGGEAKYQFPVQFSKFVVGSLPYPKMLSAFQRFKVILNVNTVTESPTMCSRRLFEAAACGAAVVSTDAAAVRHFFDPTEIPIIHDQEQGAALLRALVQSPEMRDRISHLAQRRIWEHHTYRHRASELLTNIGLLVPQEEAGTRVTIIASTNRPDQINHLLSQVARQTGVNVELQLGLHGIEVDPAKVAEQFPAHVAGEVHAFPKEWSLGMCLNELARAASGEVIAKFDDDDLYGDNYLRDQVNALRYSGADIVGKQASYMYIEESDLFVLRNPKHEMCFTTFAAGPTLVWHRDVLEHIQFPDRTKGEDTGFLDAAVRRGLKIYSADRFNFVQVRHRGGAHTWEVDTMILLANSEVRSINSGALNVDL